MGLPKDDEDEAAKTPRGKADASQQAQPTAIRISSDNTQRDEFSLGPSRSSSRKATGNELYNDTVFAKIAADDRFQHATLGVIVLNALWIGIDTEWNHKKLVNDKDEYPLDPTATVIENVFCFYFTVEVIIRFVAFRRKVYCLQDFWFVFDTALVLCMILETWVMVIVMAVQDSDSGSSFLSNFSALRLLRLLRLTRIARLMRSVPELMTLVKGMVSAARAVGFILLFLMLVMYVFGIIFVSIVGDAANYPPAEPGDDEDPSCEFMFATLEDSMMSLFTYGVLGDNLNPAAASILLYPNNESKWNGTLLFWLFFLFFAISSMTLLNMLIGVLCEVVNQTSTEEKEESQVSELRMCIEDAFGLIDKNHDGWVSREEWNGIKDDVTVRKSLAGLGVDAHDMDERLDQMEKTLFSRSKSKETREVGYSLDDLVTKVTEIRPDRPASALEIEMLREKVSRKDKQFRKRLNNIEQLIHRILVKQGMPVAETPSIEAITDLTEDAPAASFREVPTQVLFHELKKRDANFTEASGRGGNLAFSQPGSGGAVSYAAIRQVCN
jgi:hypothetical protein